jgi:hypothetical protein
MSLAATASSDLLHRIKSELEDIVRTLLNCRKTGEIRATIKTRMVKLLIPLFANLDNTDNIECLMGFAKYINLTAGKVLLPEEEFYSLLLAKQKLNASILIHSAFII